MNLTDHEILELNELCGAVVDGTLTEAQRSRLSRWLMESNAAREHYVRAMGQSASLHSYAGEMQSEAPEVVVRPNFYRTTLWWAGSLAAAALLMLTTIFQFRGKSGSAGGIQKTGEFVAQLTGSKDLEWTDRAQTLHSGDHLRKGQRLELARGNLEITFDSGARVVLQAPATLEINSAWDSTLRQGTLTASVPPQAIGFRVSHPSVDVVDLGTEFTMIADPNGAAEVLVLKGEVEAASRAESDPETILLRQNEARRFADSGISNVSDSERKFARFNQPVSLDRIVATTQYVHWSFDEPGGTVLKADVSGTARQEFDARLEASDAREVSASRVEGRHQRALEFNGIFFARAPFPGLSGSRPHTVAFWVKVSERAQLSDAYAMIAWSTSLTKLSSRPVHINWNRNPTEGPIGALRTDFGGGHAMGMTSLRDGRWHHVTVVFDPGSDANSAPQVKQYVDGHLESSTIVPGKARGPVGLRIPNLTDTLWLGCRLGPTGPRRDRPGQDRFRGELDELFIADRGLEPNEIVQLMQNNRPPAATALVSAP